MYLSQHSIFQEIYLFKKGKRTLSIRKERRLSVLRIVFRCTINIVLSSHLLIKSLDCENVFINLWVQVEFTVQFPTPYLEIE